MYCVWWLKFFFFLPPQITLLCFPDGSAGKESTCNAGLIPRLGRSPGEGKGYPLQYSGLENSMGTIQSMGSQIVSHDWMNDFHFLYKNKSDSGLFQQKRNLLKGCSVRFSSVAQSCPTLCDPMDCSTPGLPVHHQLPRSTQTHVHWVVMPSSHFILCRTLLLLPPIPPSIRVFSNESTLCMRWPKYWSFSFSIIPSKEHPGLIS